MPLLVILYGGLLARTVQGRIHTWQISAAPIGSGDAGEVYAVACKDHPDLTGMMKTPARIATGGTIQRQAGQIAQECLALARLDGLPQGKAHPPKLLDEAPEFTQGTASYFIVSEIAPGENMEDLLAQCRQNHKPFPHRVIITVLDALFDLFARAHHSGVLWNDVKLDHIYWHNPSGLVTVIDWGNALFLDRVSNGQRRIPPRWQDYHQLVETLGTFLQQSAPELYADLGWSEFQGQELNSPRVSVLARRIAYQEQVVGLKEMEYQSLIRVVLNHDPSLTGMQNIQTYQHILEQIGAPWDHQKVLVYAQSLVENATTDKDIQTAVRTVTVVWDLFGETLNLSWHLVREYFRNPDLLTHPNLPKCVRHTLNENWSTALWTLVSIARDGGDPTWWPQLIPALRQKDLGLVTRPPYQICQSLLTWAQTQGSAWQDQTSHLSTILNGWRDKGANLEKSPFEYALLDLIREDSKIPKRFRSEVKKSFAVGDEAIRELLQTWVNMNWDGLDKAFQQVIAWDPDRWGVINLATSLDEFKSWLMNLHEGPELGIDIADFFQDMVKTQPQVDRVMGRPPWFNTLRAMLTAIHQGAPTKNYLAEVQNYCPWLLNFANINSANNQKIEPDEAATSEVLSHFKGHLKNWSDIDAGLQAVKINAPGFHPFCKQLANSFQNVLSLNYIQDGVCAQVEKPLHHALEESCRAQNALTKWRHSLNEGDLNAAVKHLDDPQVEDWRIINHAHQVTLHWSNSILPTLQKIRSFSVQENLEQKYHQEEALLGVMTAIREINHTWLQVYDDRLHLWLLENLASAIELARASFINWRKSMEHTQDKMTRLLYHSNLEVIRAVSDSLLILSQYSRKAVLNFAQLDEAAEVPTRIQIKALDNLLDHLTGIERILISDPGIKHFPEWHNAISEILDTKDTETRRQMVLSLAENHPLYPWLVETIFNTNK